MIKLLKSFRPNMENYKSSRVLMYFSYRRAITATNMLNRREIAIFVDGKVWWDTKLQLIKTFCKEKI